MVVAMGTADQKAILGDFAAARIAYLAGFEEMVRTIQNRNRLIEEKALPLDNSIAELSEQIKLSLKSDQDDFGPRVQKSNDDTIGAVVVVSAIAIGLAILIAWMFVRTINRSVAALGLSEAETDRLSREIVAREETERKLAVALREVQRVNFLSDIALELTGCGYFFIDCSQPEYCYASERTARLLGETPTKEGRYSNEAWAARSEEADREASIEARDRYRGALEGRYENYDATYAYKRRADGKIIWLHALAKIVRDDDGNVECLNGVVQDITERKRAEQALADAEQRSRSLLESAPDGMMIADEQGQIVIVNAQFEVLFGYAKEEIVGQHIEVLLPERYRHQHIGQRTSFFSSPSVRAMGSGRELFARRKDGTELPVEISLSPLQTEEGVLVSSSIRDISERRQAEAELVRARRAAEAANQAKSDFLANMSHEIRTPMNGIMGMTELALDTELTGEQREFLETIDSSAKSLLSLINDILDFSKIEANKLELDPVDFELRERIGETLSTLAVRTHAKNLELAVDVASEVPERLVGDINRIRQVLINLLGNAIKFTDQGEIVLRIDLVRQREQQVTLRFAVTDTGIGLPEEKLETIFQPFEQADASTTRKYGGTGLGLAICVRLVELMGGKMKVDSVLGRGTTFSFTAELELGSGLSSERLSTPPRELRGMRVLIVDDNATNRRILMKMLENWGMQPEAVDSAAEALQTLHATTPDRPFGLVVSDVIMPETDGFMLAEQIKSDLLLKDIPIILLTSANRSGDGARCRELGIAAHLIKPARQSLLFDSIASSVGSMGVEPRSSRRGPTEPALASGPAALHLLLAEDNAINQKFAVRALSKVGHTVTVANNGQEAVDAWSEGTFDAILMDIQMPIMDGNLATAEIRKREASSGRRIPIIAMTAHAMKGDREMCLAAGMDGYVTKPIKTKLMLAEIARVLNGESSL
jgi:PAS domain S-box-containing protein